MSCFPPLLQDDELQSLNGDARAPSVLVHDVFCSEALMNKGGNCLQSRNFMMYSTAVGCHRGWLFEWSRHMALVGYHPHLILNQNFMM